jgi:hypothetical protein
MLNCFFRKLKGGSASPKTMAKAVAKGANIMRQKPHANAFHRLLTVDALV